MRSEMYVLIYRVSDQTTHWLSVTVDDNVVEYGGDSGKFLEG